MFSKSKEAKAVCIHNAWFVQYPKPRKAERCHNKATALYDAAEFNNSQDRTDDNDFQIVHGPGGGGMGDDSKVTISPQDIMTTDVWYAQAT